MSYVVFTIILNRKMLHTNEENEDTLEKLQQSLKR